MRTENGTSGDGTPRLVFANPDGGAVMGTSGRDEGTRDQVAAGRRALPSPTGIDIQADIVRGHLERMRNEHNDEMENGPEWAYARIMSRAIAFLTFIFPLMMSSSENALANSLQWGGFGTALCCAWDLRVRLSFDSFCNYRFFPTGGLGKRHLFYKDAAAIGLFVVISYLFTLSSSLVATAHSNTSTYAYTAIRNLALISLVCSALIRFLDSPPQVAMPIHVLRHVD